MITTQHHDIDSGIYCDFF